MKLSTLFVTTALIAGSMAVQAADSPRKVDSEALGWLIVVDQNEIDLSKAAKARKLDPAVIESSNLLRLLILPVPDVSEVSVFPPEVEFF